MAQAKPLRQGKIFVFKVSQYLSDAELRTCFEAYGAVVDVSRPFDRARNQPKSFCFVTFANEEPAQILLRKGTVHFAGHVLAIREYKSGGARGAGRTQFGGGCGGRGYNGKSGGNGGYVGYGGQVPRLRPQHRR